MPALLWLLVAGPALAAPPAPGHYLGQMCVATRADQPASCGPAEIDWQGGDQLTVRLSDIVYRLRLRTSKLEATTSQGRMRIDAFDAPYAWSGRALGFTDEAKSVRYEIRLGARRAGR